MKLPISRFFIFFLFVLFVLSVSLSQKSVSIFYKNDHHSFLTYERTIQDVLQSNNYSIVFSTKNADLLKKPLKENMVITILQTDLIEVEP